MNQKLPDSKKGTRQTNKYNRMIRILKAIKDRLISFLNFSFLSTGNQIRLKYFNWMKEGYNYFLFAAKIKTIPPYFKYH